MRGWDATGRLSAHWAKVGKRDRLAEMTGIAPATLSAYNSGARPLGRKNGEKIAAALGVTIYDLGAPTAEEEVAGAETVLERLDELAQLRDDVDALRLEIRARVDRIEKRLRPPRKARDVRGGR